MSLQGTIVPGRLRSELQPWGVTTSLLKFDEIKTSFWLLGSNQDVSGEIKIATHNQI